MAKLSQKLTRALSDARSRWISRVGAVAVALVAAGTTSPVFAEPAAPASEGIDAIKRELALFEEASTAWPSQLAEAAQRLGELAGGDAGPTETPAAGVPAATRAVAKAIEQVARFRSIVTAGIGGDDTAESAAFKSAQARLYLNLARSSVTRAHTAALTGGVTDEGLLGGLLTLGRAMDDVLTDQGGAGGPLRSASSRTRS